jgi:hypothetical protein
VITATGTATSLGCNPTASDIDAALGTATATDACSSVTVTATDGAVSTTNCSSSQTRIFTAVDGCGNSATSSRTITWTTCQTTPTFAPIGPLCQNSIAPPLPGTSLNNFTGSWSPATISTSTVGTTTYTFTSTDACATTASISVTITAQVDTNLCSDRSTVSE